MRFQHILLLVFLVMGAKVSLQAQTVLFTDFNSGIPASWTIVNGGTTADTWYGTTNGFNNNYLDATNFAFVNSDAAGNGSNIDLSEQLISPTINGTLYSQMFLEFDHYYRDYSLDSGFVEVFNGSAWITLAAYSTNTGAWNAPAHPTFNLTPYLNANLKVRFRYEDNTIWAWWWAVDNVHLYAPLTQNAAVDSVIVPTSNCGLTTSETIGVVIRNAGIANISNVPVSFRVNSGAIHTETVPGPIIPGATQNYTFTTGANLVFAGVYNIKVWTSLSGDTDYLNDTLAAPTIANHVRVTPNPYVQNFENGTGGWFATGQNSTWAWGNPQKTVIIGAASGSKAWVTGGLTPADYLDNDHSQVEGPCFNLSGLSNPWVGMNIWWNCEWSWDGAALQASQDGGQTWITIGAFGDPWDWYTDNTIDGMPGGQNNGWSGRAATNDGSNGYRRAVHSLAAVAGQPEVIVRVAFGSDGSVRDDGIAFDDFTVANGPSLYLGPDTTGCDSLTLNAGPATSYSWNTGDTTQTITTDSSGLYSVVIRNGYGFPVGDQIQVTLYQTSGLDLGADTSLCGSAGLNLMADPVAQSFLWNTGATTATLPVNTTGQYWVQATYPPGCVATDTISVSISTLQAAISLASDTLCRGVITPFADASTGAQTWWWDFGDGSFSSQPNPVHVYTAGGTFLLQLTVTDSNCSHTTARAVYVDICTGLENAALSGGRLWPNPASDEFQLEILADAPGPATIEVWDAGGRMVRQEEWELASGTNLRRFRTDDWVAGMYFIRVKGPSISWSAKLILVP